MEKNKLILTPINTLAICMTYMGYPDRAMLGSVEANRENELIIADKILAQALDSTTADELIDQAIEYCKNTPVDAFLDQAAPLLSEDQRLSVLLHTLDILFADGIAEERELALLKRLTEKLADGKSAEVVRGFIALTSEKKDISVLC